MAPGSVSPLAVEVAKNQWAGFHLAAADVHQHLPGTADGEDGEDLPRPGARGEEPEGIARIHQAAALEIPAGGQRRPPRRLGCGGRSDSAAAHHPVEKVTGPFLGCDAGESQDASQLFWRSCNNRFEFILKTAVDSRQSRQVRDLSGFPTAAQFTQWVTNAIAATTCD